MTTVNCACDCDCGTALVELPIKSLKFGVDASALGGLGGGSIDYSYEEQFTGRRWVDGKKIYQKTVDCGALPNKSTKVVAHGIANLDQIIDMRAIADSRSSAGARIINPLPLTTTVDNWEILFQSNDTNLLFRISANININATYATIWYTCTDR